jgi:hypothetical protein
MKNYSEYEVIITLTETVALNQLFSSLLDLRINSCKKKIKLETDHGMGKRIRDLA